MEESLSAKLFSWEDYTVFGSMLLVSAAIGMYYGLTRRSATNKKDDYEAQDFLIGHGKLKTVPVALSTLAGFLSSITLIGQPAEVYLFGPQIWLFGFGCFIAVPVVAYIAVPFFRSLKTASAYEFFGNRFNRSFQLLSSTIFSLQIVLFLALVLYAPALALHQVTGIDTKVVLVVMYIICIFYTTVGGIRAVVLTDTFQVVVLSVAMLAVVIKGTLEIGGLKVVWQRNSIHQRGNFFNFDPDPTVRYSVWSSLLGGAFLHLFTFCGNQLQIQRLLSVSTDKEARKVVWIYAIGWALVTSLTAYAGILIFASYQDCDPLASGRVKSADHLFPLYVMDVLGDFPGFPGLFTAGIFSAGLSTASTGINSLAAIWFGEMNGTAFKASLTPRKADLTVKILSLGFGILSFAVVFIVPYLGALVPVAISLNGFFSGALSGIFFLGIYTKRANSWGAFAGLISGTGLTAYLVIGSQISINNDLAVFDVLPLSTEGCSANVTLVSSSKKDLAPLIYRISFLWYSLIAFVITVLVGIVVSALTNYLEMKINGKCPKKYGEMPPEFVRLMK